MAVVSRICCLLFSLASYSTTDLTLLVLRSMGGAQVLGVSARTDRTFAAQTSLCSHVSVFPKTKRIGYRSTVLPSYPHVYPLLHINIHTNTYIRLSP